MPVPSRPDPAALFVLGVDGCRAGWAAARLSVNEGPEAPQLRVFASFAAMLADPWGAEAAAIAVDAPIGLAEAGRRGCDGLARRYLGRPRASSIFAAPRRPMLACATYAEANALGKAQGPDAGGGLSKQAWNILPKIREIDDAIGPADQTRIFEAHPEVAFRRLAGRDLGAKASPGGAGARRLALRRAGVREAAARTKALRAAHAGVAADDVLDAMVLALAARARLAGEALRFSDDRRDARGLVMEIWG